MYCGIDDDPNGPVIPNQCFELRMYRFRRSRNKWQRLAHDYTINEEETPEKFRLLTYNVNFEATFAAKRVEEILRHVEEDVLDCRGGEAPEPCVVMLQEVQLAQMDAILGNGWVREHFLVTPVDVHKWPANALFGTVTLVEKSIPVERAHSLHFGESYMERMALIVDIRLAAPKPKEYDVILRMINTHLESLEDPWQARVAQMKLLTKFLKGPGIRGGIIAGDMNPVSAHDKGLSESLGLKDAWLKADDDPEGFTWGEMPPHHKFPPKRFDKVLYLPRKGYRVKEPKRIGVDLKLRTDRMPTGWIYASDHCGLETTVQVLRFPSSLPTTPTTMKSALFLAALVAAAAAQLQINTPVPGASQCEPQLVSWSGGTPPLLHRESSSPVELTSPHVLLSSRTVQNNPISGTAVKDFGQQTGNSLTWTVDLPLGQSVILQVKDSTGASQTSAPFNIIAGQGDSCLSAGGGNVSTPPSTGGSTSAPAGGAGTTSAPAGGASTPAGGASTPAGSARPSSTGSGAGSASRSGASATPSGAALSAVAVPAGVLPACAAMLGAVVVALYA
ncbi:hypothetical protein MKEN_00361500 [Mycena kentingensis (nom. inval.)]|nr:hypothetical protein MKEN_00361500 [Mycena kentingensis (nom. inval.)]